MGRLAPETVAKHAGLIVGEDVMVDINNITVPASFRDEEVRTKYQKAAEELMRIQNKR